MKCIYCGKPTTCKDNQNNPVCVNEYVCENLPVPTLEEELGSDPTGRCWSETADGAYDYSDPIA